MRKLIDGGIGDILLSLEGALAEESIDLFSHFAGAKQMVEQAGVKVENFVYYQDKSPADKTTENVVPLSLYPSFKLPVSPQEVKAKLSLDDRKIVGIHPFGSKYSNDYWGKQGYPLKSFSQENVIHIIDRLREVYQFLIFGTPDELEEYKYCYSNNDAQPVCLPIWESLAAVRLCEAVVATDSAIKTMSAISRIPTKVYLGNYNDMFRDKVFIEPYIRDGVMQVWQYIKTTNNMFDPVIDALLSY